MLRGNLRKILSGSVEEARYIKQAVSAAPRLTFAKAVVTEQSFLFCFAYSVKIINCSLDAEMNSSKGTYQFKCCLQLKFIFDL